jgi:rhodanese-related sulfurtransferase
LSLRPEKAARPRSVAVKWVLLEALLIAAGGALLAFAANALSPRGLKLGRDYFAYSPGPAVSAAPQPAPAAANPPNNATPLAQLAAQGIRLANSNRVVALFRDPRYAQNLVVFVDARNPQEYEAGHIPGAYEFDRFHPENYLGPVLAVCQLAQQVLVYCNGGECEDSAFAAMFLLSAGVPSQKLLVYPGGITEWSTNGLPIELGQRGSGRFLEAKR